MKATMTEKPIPTGEGLTFEKVWAMFQESTKEYDRRSKEADQQRKKEAAKRNKEAAKRKKELDQLMNETRKQMKETDRKIGELGNRFGELAEHLVAPGIADRFNELGHHFDGVAPGGYTIKDEMGKEIAEVDILLENGDCIMAVEVKTRPRPQDIEHHIKRMEILRKHRNKKNDKRKILGAIAGVVFGSSEKQAAIDAGFYVLVQSGDTMKMSIPSDFIPRAW